MPTTATRPLVRIVRMTLRPEGVDDFLEMFERVSPHIRATPGCEHLELLQEVGRPEVVSTYSRWTDENALEAYRSSDLFRETWTYTKTLFAARPSARSFREVG